MTQPAAALESLTPMMRQYYELKGKVGDAILFFRMGDFYEIFGADAEEVAPVLELTMTSRERGDQQRIPFCGVPHHSARNYWLKLLKRGYKVALADQVEDPAEAKGLVRREIIRVLTPGAVDDPEGLERDAPNYVLAVHEEPGLGKWTVALADLSTGELRLGNVDGIAQVKPLVERFRPKELLARKFFHEDLAALLQGYRSDHRLLIEALPEAPLRDAAEQKALLTEVFGKHELASQPSGPCAGGEALIAAVLIHFRQLQASLSQFLSVRPLYEANTMILDESALRDLEVFETARRRESEGSLFKEINQTQSPMGARLLRYFLAHPLLDASQIRGRHQAVRALIQLGETKLQEVRQELKHLPDLERLATRVFAGIAQPPELTKVVHALEKAKWLLEGVTGERAERLPQDLFRAMATGLKFHKNPLKVLQAALVEAPRPLGTGIGVFKPGFDKELDQLAESATTGEAQVEAYQEKLRAQTGIASLKIKSHKSYGLLIEITRANAAKVPKDFIRRQTMVNCERFTTVELNELNDTLGAAMDRAVAREDELYRALLLDLGKFRMDLRSVAHALATFDLLQSFAWQALRFGYCEPRIADDDKVELKGSRHPVVERYVGRAGFSPNDLTLSPTKKLLLITGPNMAGKSTVMRQTALCAILCQIGSFVPAEAARLPVFDRVFTRVGAADDLSRGQSTFMVEMSEAANILRHATQKSLVILDEVGRGTSTSDGLALASAILTDLSQRVRCHALFATHYHELVPLAAGLSNVQPMQTEVIEREGRIVFTHRLKEGATSSSFGIEVARLAGIPEAVIQRATAFLTEQRAQPEAPAPRARPGASREAQKPAVAAGKDVERAVEWFERLARLNVNRLTPIQALNILAEMQAPPRARGQASLFPEDAL